MFTNAVQETTAHWKTADRILNCVESQFTSLPIRDANLIPARYEKKLA